MNPDPKIFLSTLSLRRATANSGPCNGRLLHFYPRSPCGERHSIGTLRTVSVKISIHALLAESDIRSIRQGTASRIFLSTLSLRRATWYPFGYFGCNCYFYPRSPCGERHYFSAVMRQNPGISIHALLAESDPKGSDNAGKSQVFLSTLSLRRATGLP